MWARENRSESFTSVNSDPQYTVAEPRSLTGRLSNHYRRLMFDAFMREMGIEPSHSVVDVGCTSDRSHDHSNYFEALYPHKSCITAVGVEDASFLEVLHPGLRFVRADGLDLPMRDGSFDFAHSSAVIEHVGSHTNQAQFLRELWRVARNGIFVTTPNRWFPIEVHTLIPLVHYLPPSGFRRVLTMLGKDFFANEANLNLMSRNTLSSAARCAGIDNFRIESLALLGWPSNLMLIARKSALDQRSQHKSEILRC
jgi:Methyltransferase domain